MKRRKLGNGGSSLVELMVVVTILGICAAMIASSLTTVSAARVRKCANQTDALLSQCKVAAMSREAPVYLRLYKDGGGAFRGELYEKGVAVLDEELGPKGIGVSFVAGGARVELGDGDSLYLSFDRSTGAFIPLADVKNGAVSLNGAGYAGGVFCTELRFISGTTVKITLVPVTGYHRIG